MNNIRIKFKIMAIVVAGLIGLIAVSAYLFKGILDTRDRAEYSERVVDIVVNKNALIHEMQKERGFSSGVLAGGDNAKLLAQRKLVDAALERLKEKDEIQTKLTSLRKSVDSRQSAGQLAQFTKMIRDEIISINGYSAHIDPNLVDDLKRSLIIGEIKESYGILRATLVGVFTKRSIDKIDYNKVVSLDSVIGKFSKDFDDFNHKNFRDEFDRIVRDKSEFKEVGKIVKDTIEISSGYTPEYSPSAWFEKATAVIDQMREFELQLLENMKNQASIIEKNANNQLMISAVLIAFCLIIPLIISIIIGKNLIKNIESTKSGLVEFFNFLNNKSQNAKLLNLQGSDEFGQMASLINDNISKIESAKLSEN
ncbi:nitrate- and nitrite sensing domain-containing protein, partial [Campylobacter sp. MOP7]|uniref:nitrate- and nitrite sensing domain-containing protein n=1 Tax=Campylobacter canis TaxID=3378588 RepID=UPI00387EB5BD